MDFSSFHKYTYATFKPCQAPTRDPDFISDSGSKYWDTGIEVIRQADHWGHAQRYYWTTERDDWSGISCGFCEYKNFWSIVALTIEREKRIRFRRCITNIRGFISAYRTVKNRRGKVYLFIDIYVSNA